VYTLKHSKRKSLHFTSTYPEGTVEPLNIISSLLMTLWFLKWLCSAWPLITGNVHMHVLMFIVILYWIVSERIFDHWLQLIQENNHITLWLLSVCNASYRWHVTCVSYNTHEFNDVYHFVKESLKNDTSKATYYFPSWYNLIHGSYRW
jgi:hypothetical protein